MYLKLFLVLIAFVFTSCASNKGNVKNEEPTVKNFALIVSGPSGVGKTTIVNKIAEKYKDSLIVSISATTRQSRKGEIDGKDYFFITKDQFNRLQKEGEFLESMTYHGNSYGTPKTNYFDAISAKKDIVFTIDSAGLETVKKLGNIKYVSIFIAPPSISELKSRLIKRAEKTKEDVRQRIANIEKELDAALKYDYIVYNCDLDKATKLVEAIYLSERYKNS